MPDNEKADGLGGYSGNTAPPRLIQSEILSSADAHPQVSANKQTTAKGNEQAAKETRRKQVPWLDIINSVATFVMALAAIGTLIVATNTQDIQKAVSQIAKLAAAASKQANAAQSQIGIMRSQLQAMHDAALDSKKLIDANVKLADAAQNSAATADQNLIATQRAWVGTTDASIVGPLPVGIIKGTVSYVNSGKEPAKFSAIAKESLYSRDEWAHGSAVGSIVAYQESCLKVSAISGFRFAWPTTGFQTYFFHFPEGQIPQAGVVGWSDRIRNGEDIVAIQGCITYEAFGKSITPRSAIFTTARCPILRI